MKITNAIIYSYKTLFKVTPISAVLLFVSTILIGLIPGAQAFLFTLLVDNLAIKKNMLSVFTPVIVLAGISILFLILRLINNVVGKHIKNRLNTYISMTFMEKTNSLNAISFEIEETHKKIYRAKENINSPHKFIMNFQNLLQTILTLISFVVYTSTINIWLGIVFIFCMFIYWLQTYVQSNKEYKNNIEQTNQHKHLNYLSEIITDKKYAKELRIYNFGDYIIEHWKKISDKVNTVYLTMRQKHVVRNIFLTSSGYLIIGLFFVFISVSVGTGSASTGSFAGFVTFLGQLGNLIQGIGPNLRNVNLSRLQVDELTGFLDSSIGEDSTNKLKLTNVQGHIKLDNIFFRYPGCEKFVLDGVTLEINPGETIAIVGDNGAGKTTLSNIIAGLFDPTLGEILIDGINYKDINKEELYQKIIPVYQKPIRYDLTFKENICFEDYDSKKLHDVISNFKLEGILDKLPENEDTVLGKAFGNVDLSGGEWQKIAMARCNFKNPDIVILDEPTSAFDPIYEKEIFDLICENIQKKTTIIISHRLGWLKNVDKIYVLKNGKIVESGHHDSLYEQNGEYRRMYDLQAQWYQAQLT